MRKASNNNIGEILGNWFVRYARIIMPVVLAVAVIITIVIAVRANKKETETQEDVEANITLENTSDKPAAVPEVPLLENDNPEVEELMDKYYTALAAGDIDTIRTLIDDIDETEILRIKETSKYVEAYSIQDIYTKAGPVENSYLVYTCMEAKFADYEEPIPGMRVWYVCVDENGRYYINENGDGTEDELNYIREVSLQDDVVDLNNKVTVAYNDMLASDVDLQLLIQDVNIEIEKNVGEALQAQAEAGSEPEETADDTDAGGGTGDADAEIVVTKVKATDVVNIRSSDSETADKVGKAAIGDEFKLVEKIGNGWSRIEYEGKDAYIKSEYLEDVETTLAASDSTETADNDTPAAAASSDNGGKVTGTVMAKASVKIRSSASTESEALGTAYAGDKLDMIVEQADGWTRIKYKGRTAFVKSEYVE